MKAFTIIAALLISASFARANDPVPAAATPPPAEKAMEKPADAKPAADAKAEKKEKKKKKKEDKEKKG